MTPATTSISARPAKLLVASTARPEALDRRSSRPAPPLRAAPKTDRTGGRPTPAGAVDAPSLPPRSGRDRAAAGGPATRLDAAIRLLGRVALAGAALGAVGLGVYLGLPLIAPGLLASGRVGTLLVLACAWTAVVATASGAAALACWLVLLLIRLARPTPAARAARAAPVPSPLEAARSQAVKLAPQDTFTGADTPLPPATQQATQPPPPSPAAAGATTPAEDPAATPSGSPPPATPPLAAAAASAPGGMLASLPASLPAQETAPAPPLTLENRIDPAPRPAPSPQLACVRPPSALAPARPNFVPSLATLRPIAEQSPAPSGPSSPAEAPSPPSLADELAANGGADEQNPFFVTLPDDAPMFAPAAAALDPVIDELQAAADQLREENEELTGELHEVRAQMEAREAELEAANQTVVDVRTVAEAQVRSEANARRRERQTTMDLQVALAAARAELESARVVGAPPEPVPTRAARRRSSGTAVELEAALHLQTALQERLHAVEEESRVRGRELVTLRARDRQQQGRLTSYKLEVDELTRALHLEQDQAIRLRRELEVLALPPLPSTDLAASP